MINIKKNIILNGDKLACNYNYLLPAIKTGIYNFLLSYDKISNFDFIINGRCTDEIGKFTTDTNTADINSINKIIIDREANIICKQQVLSSINLQNLFPLDHGLLSDSTCNIGIKFIKPRTYISPHCHNTGDDSPVIFGCLLNNLDTPSELFVGDAAYVSINSNYKDPDKTLYMDKQGDTFLFEGEYVHSFYSHVYTELLLISFNKKALLL